ncbi:MAG: lysophospholipid acyltransferase family protein [Thiotrichales bacterium]|nr:MAG: lysophospholipid acyltransferase family protein [Thiotrichales bacterium]
MLKKLSLLVLSLLGWQLESKLPDEKKFVIIGAFHTSNWDFPLGILGMWALGLKASWVGKHTLFRGPLGPLFKLLGGIPVDRTVHTGFIQRVAELYKTRAQMALTIAAEGTRSRTEHWKTGFYFIAHEAGVPIALGYLDYGNKRLGVGATLYPGGDIVKDFEKIREFYRDKSGLRPENQGPVILPPKYSGKRAGEPEPERN